jgi:hypothetical protein
MAGTACRAISISKGMYISISAMGSSPVEELLLAAFCSIAVGRNKIRGQYIEEMTTFS